MVLTYLIRQVHDDRWTVALLGREEVAPIARILHQLWRVGDERQGVLRSFGLKIRGDIQVKVQLDKI